MRLPREACRDEGSTMNRSVGRALLASLLLSLAFVGTARADVLVLKDKGDVRGARFEGKLISKMLALGGKECRYFYVRTKRELSEVLKLFSKSGYRYLHLSCHGSDDKQTLHTTLDAIPFNVTAGNLRIVQVG